MKTKHKTNNSDWTKYFKGKKVLSAIDIHDDLSGIYALSFKGVNHMDYFHPVYVFTTNNLNVTAQELIQQATSDVANSIYKYIQSTDTGIENIIFVELEKEISEEKLNNWINILETRERGFNT